MVSPSFTPSLSCSSLSDGDDSHDCSPFTLNSLQFASLITSKLTQNSLSQMLLLRGLPEVRIVSPPEGGARAFTAANPECDAARPELLRRCRSDGNWPRRFAERRTGTDERAQLVYSRSRERILCSSLSVSDFDVVFFPSWRCC